jgi:hypothetical protein
MAARVTALLAGGAGGLHLIASAGPLKEFVGGLATANIRREMLLAGGNVWKTGQRYPLATKTASYVLTDNDHTILADATAGAITQTLPTPVGRDGAEFVIARANDAGGDVTVDTAAGTINGAAAILLAGQYQSKTFRSDGANWYIVSGNGPLIIPSTPLGAASQTITIPGIPASATLVRWGLRATNDTGAEDYVRVRPVALTTDLSSEAAQFSNGGQSGFRETTLWVATMRAGAGRLVNATGAFIARNGGQRAYFSDAVSEDVGGGTFTATDTKGAWKATTPALTSIVFRCDTAASFAAASHAWAEVVF